MPVTTRGSLLTQVVELVEGGTFSRGSYDSTDKPFFEGDSDRTSEPWNTMSSRERQTLKGKISKTVLDKHFKRFFEIICTEKADSKSEFYYKSWTVMSFDNIMERYAHYVKNGQTDLIDIAFCYGGMGYIMKLSYVPSRDTYVFLTDGGSNGWERERHAQDSIAFKVKANTIGHTFMEVLDIFNDEDLEYFTLPVSEY